MRKKNMNVIQIKKTILRLFLIALAVFSLPAHSANWFWLSESAISRFTDSDWAMLKSTATDALDNAADGTRVVWVNSETGHSGAITPINKTEKDGMPCRKVKFFSSAEGLTNTGTHLLCKQKDGEWKLDH